MTGDHVVQIPEPDPGMGDAVLSSLWSERDALPKIEGTQVWLYYMREAISSVMALPMSSFITVVTIAISLFLLSGFLFLLQNVDRVLSEAGGTLYLTAYIKDDVSRHRVDVFSESLTQHALIQDVEYVSKAEALENFREDLGNRSSFLIGLEKENPLPASLEIVVRPEAKGVDQTEELVASIRQSDVVQEVLYGGEWVDRMQGVVKIFRLFGIIALLIVLVVIMFLIANTIKLVIFSRRDELSIMQLVGAPDSFIRIPFVLGGVVQGGVGAVSALFSLFLVTVILNHEIRDSALFGVTLPELSFLSAPATLGILFVGLAVGAMGSFFALGKFMNV